jgi:hypothetical protein
MAETKQAKPKPTQTDGGKIRGKPEESSRHQFTFETVGAEQHDAIPDEATDDAPSGLLDPAPSAILRRQPSALAAAEPKPAPQNAPARPTFGGRDFAGVPTHAAGHPTVQPKLTVGPAGDRFEQEADRVAEQVLAMPAPVVAPPAPAQPPAAGGEGYGGGEPPAAGGGGETGSGPPLAQRQTPEQEEEEKVQAKPLAAAITPLVQRAAEEDEEEASTEQSAQEEDEIRTRRGSAADGFEASDEFESCLAAARGGGRPLPAVQRAFMEPRFGADFSGVRVHTGGEAAQLNRAVSARAFTHGQDIFLGDGQADLESSAGQQLLAHELTHVVQQRGAPLQRRPEWGEVVQRDGTEELEEDMAVQRSVLAGAVTPRPGGPIIQRDLTGQLNIAMSGHAINSATIVAEIRAAPADQKLMVLQDPVLMNRLRSSLSRADAITALTELGAPLDQRLEVALSGSGAASAAILAMINPVPPTPAVPAAEKQAVLGNPTLMTNLRRKLSRADALTAMQGLGAGLAERLQAAMEGAGVDAAAIIQMAHNASPDEKQAALHDRALIARLRSDLTRVQMLNVLDELGASLADRLNAAMEGRGVDSATILTLTQNATDAQRQEVLNDSALMGQLQSRLSRADMATVLTNLHASLADRLNLALGVRGADAAAILAMIPTVPEAERLAAHDDAALIASLRSRLDNDSYWQARLLLRFGTQAVIDAPSTQVPALSNGVYYRVNAHIQDRQHAQALSTLVSYLEGHGVLTPANYTRITYNAAGAGEGLTTANFTHNATTGNWSVSSPPRVTIHPAAFADVGWLYSTIMREYQHVLRYAAGYTQDPRSAAQGDVREVEAHLWEIEHARDTGVINNPAQLHEVGNRLTAHFNALGAADKVPYQARYTAAMAIVNAVPLPAGPAPAPAGAPQSLTALLSTAMGQRRPNTAQMLLDITAASPADKEAVRLNHSLMRRLAATLSRADMREALRLLGLPMVERLNLLVNQRASAADITALINSGTPADKQAVLANAALVNRLLAYLNRADAGQVLAALGDTLENRLNRAATGRAVDANVIFAMIRAATPAERNSIALNTALLTTLSAALSAYNYWKVRLLLQYGTEASFPPGVTTMVAALQGTPTAASIRTAISSLSEADYAVVRNLVGIQEVLHARVPNSANYMAILRALIQGLVSEQRNVGGSYGETLLAPVPGATGPLVFVPQTFTGTRGFDVAYYRDRLQIRVRIRLDPRDATATTDRAAKSVDWRNWIEAAWDNKFSLQNANHTLRIRVSCEFTNSNPHHTVHIYSTMSTGWPAYNMDHWYYNQIAGVAPAGVPTYSPRAMVHEFGHMLGNPDEYGLSAADFQARTGAAPTAATATAQTDTAATTRYTARTSVMSQGSEPVQARHFDYFRDWINAHLRKDAAGHDLEPPFTII